ncbi:MAG: hypothetical protein FWG61_08430 [Firmicutes bacterium]|nr:hypothetical protein [Bacillota bacterium]
MEESALAKQVADDLKNIIAASINCIREGNYQLSHEYLNQALSLTELIDYHAGSAMVLHNLANLYTLKGDNIEAMKTAALALKKAQAASIAVLPYQQLLHSLYLAVQKEGVEYVKSKNYVQALNSFEQSLPYAPQEKRTWLEKQITLLRRV